MISFLERSRSFVLVPSSRCRDTFLHASLTSVHLTEAKMKLGNANKKVGCRLRALRAAAPRPYNILIENKVGLGLRSEWQ